MAKRGRAGALEIVGTWFKGMKHIIVQDGRTMTSMRAKRIHENALKGGCEAAVLVEYNPGKRSVQGQFDPDEVDGFTHLVTELADPARVVADLGLKPQEEGGPKPIKPQWVSKCFTTKSLEDENQYIDFSNIAPIPPSSAPVPPSASSASASSAPSAHGAASPWANESGSSSPQSKKARVASSSEEPEYEELPLSVLNDYEGLDDQTREALLAWYGGKLRKYKPKDFPKWACQRPTVLKHANQAVARVIEELVEIYNAIGDSGREISFGRLLSIIRAWPTRIRSSNELKGVLKVGESGRKEVDEVLRTGTSTRLEELRRNPEHQSLVDLCRVHGVGHRTAARWIQAGYRSVDQIKAELDSEEGSGQSCRFREVCAPSREHLLGLRHFYDVNEKMPREMVTELGKLISRAAARHLAKEGIAEDKLLVEIAGSYRRGKPFSGDLDIIMTVSDGESHKDMREGLKNELNEMKADLIVLKDTAEGGYTTREVKIHEKMESHQNILTMVKFEGKYRRVDVITVPYPQWAFAILGWSGSKQLEKDIRDHANERGLHLSQQSVYSLEKGLSVKNPKTEDGVFHTEEDIFEFLGLKFLPPCLRWA